ncbi:hypothetical protein TNCV_4489721 [Trichonephila clavipes]|nr:hypothetical protein TNCV_4489721 [Trichonephila clavipes]
MTVPELQQKVNLKSSSNITTLLTLPTLLIPQHLSFKRKYSQDKRGIGKIAWKLPDFIKRVVIMKERQLLRGREDNESQAEERS